MTTIQNIKLTRIAPGHYEFRSTFDGARTGHEFVWTVYQGDDGDWNDHPRIEDETGAFLAVDDSFCEHDRYCRYRDIKTAIESAIVSICRIESLGSYSLRLNG